MSWYSEDAKQLPSNRKMSLQRLDQLAEIFVGVNTTRMSVAGTQPSHLINVRDIEGGELAALPELTRIHLSDDFLRNQQHQILRPDDVLVTIRGTLLKSALIRKTHVGAVAAAGIAILRSNGRLRPELILAAFRSTALQSQLRQMAVGSTIQGIHLKIIKDVEVQVPEERRQKQLAELFRLSDAQFRDDLSLANMRRILALSVVTNSIGIGVTDE